MAKEAAKEEKVPAIYPAMAAVATALAEAGLGKDQFNDQQRYHFRAIDDLYNLTGVLFARHKIISVPVGIEASRSEYTTDRGKKMMNVVTRNKFRFISLEDGSFIEAEMTGEGSDNSDKATNKANSGAHKYLLLQTFNVPLQGGQVDREGDFTTNERGADPQPSRAQRRPPAQAEQEAPEDPGYEESDNPPGPGPEDEEQYAEEISRIETALHETVAGEEDREKVRSKICDAYGVMLLDQIPEERVDEAIAKLKDYWAKVTSKGKKGRRANS